MFVGPSGCGKSTLLRMIAGLEKITSGTLEIDGVRVNDMPPSERGIAMVFQSYALYPHMTVHDNMSFALKIAKKSKEEIEAAVSKAARILQLTDYLDRLPKALSGGQRQRVAIGRSIVRDPKVYLFDEPLSNLDAAPARGHADRDRPAQGVDARIDHDLRHPRPGGGDDARLADRRAGQQGHRPGGLALQLYERPENEFVAQFIGSPAMNLLSGEIVETGPETVIKLHGGGVARSAVPTQAADRGMAVNIGVRPEDMTTAREGGEYIYEGKVGITEALGEVTLIYYEPESPDAVPVIGKLAGIHGDLRGNMVKMSATPPRSMSSPKDARSSTATA